MSSPQVLTFTHAPLEQARAGNREECLHYLEQAREVLRTLGDRSRQLRDAGFPVDAPAHATIEDAEAEMWGKFGPEEDGAEALRSIHQYYQSLKHPWSERVDAAERALAEKSKQELEAAAELARLRQLETHLVNNAAAADARRAAEARAAHLQVSAADLGARLGAQATSTAVAPAGQWIAELSNEEKVQRKVAAILATARTGAEEQQLRERIAALEPGETDLMVAHLEHLRRTRHRELEEERRAAVEAEMQLRQAAELRRSLEGALAGCEPMLSSLPFQEGAAHRKALTEALALCVPGETARAENAFAAARGQLVAAAARRPAVIAMVRELLALGYQEITPMETITAEDINARGVSTIQLGLPGHEEHLAEINFTQDGSTVAVQAVRTAATNGTAEQRAADLAAQTTLCADVDRARAGSGVQGFQPQVLKREEPGKAVPVRTAKVRRGGVFARATSGARPAASQARAASA